MELSSSDPLIERIEDAIVHNPHFNYKKMKMNLRTSRGQVVLEGKVNTFFEKQMVQEALKNVDGVNAIYNHLEVTWN